MQPQNQLMEAVERLEATIYGDPSRDKRGLVERVNQMENHVSEIRDNLKKITWLVMAGVVGAGLNLILNTRNIAASHSQQTPPSAQSK